MESIQPHDDISVKQTRSGNRVLLGLLFLLPSLYCWLSQLLLPTVNTLLMSFQKVNLLGAEAEFIGLENYARLFREEEFWQAAGFTLLTLLVRLVVVALVPLLLAWAAAQFGRSLCLGLRILLTLSIVFFTPVMIAVAWLLFLNPTNGFFPFEGSWVASPARARSTLLFIDALYLFGLASGLGLMAYLPIWRRPATVSPPAFREASKPILVLWAFGILGVIVATLSTFTLNFVLTNGGPARSTTTLGLLIYNFAFRNFNMGPAAAIASLILLVTLVSGSIAGLLVLLTRLRLDLLDRDSPSEKAAQPIEPMRNRTLAVVSLLLLLLLTVGGCLLSALPFGWLVPQAVGGEAFGQFLEQVSVGRVLFNTIVPPLAASTLQLLIAYVAALGIGALRPFGKRSEWLLLLFSPWLFIGVLPLSLSHFLANQQAGRLDTFLSSLPPVLLSIPALFILTLFFAGRASRLAHQTTEREPGFFERFIRPSLPLAVVLWLILFFFNSQEIIWPLLVSVRPERFSLNLTLLQAVRAFGAGNGMLAAVITFFLLPISIFFFLCLLPFQITYLDRLTLYTEPYVGEGETTSL